MVAVKHGEPVYEVAPPADDPELSLVTATLSFLALVDRLCECEGVCDCEASA